MSLFERPKPPAPPPASSGPSAPARGERGWAQPAPQSILGDVAPRPAADTPIEGGPIGKLFAVKQGSQTLGFFDSRAFWCVKRAEGVVMTRSAPRAVLGLLTEAQKRSLQAAQMKARRNDLR